MLFLTRCNRGHRRLFIFWWSPRKAVRSAVMQSDYSDWSENLHLLFPRHFRDLACNFTNCLKRTELPAWTPGICLGKRKGLANAIKRPEEATHAASVSDSFVCKKNRRLACKNHRAGVGYLVLASNQQANWLTHHISSRVENYLSGFVEGKAQWLRRTFNTFSCWLSEDRSLPGVCRQKVWRKPHTIGAEGVDAEVAEAGVEIGESVRYFERFNSPDYIMKIASYLIWYSLSHAWQFFYSLEIFFLRQRTDNRKLEDEVLCKVVVVLKADILVDHFLASLN